MNKMPENYIDFLYWVKETTESLWNKKPEISSDDFIFEDWIYGAKWIGLAENEIDAIEAKYSIQFMPEHRKFLKVLHAIDRKEELAYTETFEGNDEVRIVKRPFFYNWLEDDDVIKGKFKWPFETILQDIIGSNSVWLKSWGAVPDSDEEKVKVFTKWYNAAPKLIPIMSHRFLISDLNLKDRPILSIYGSDIIVYGWNFRHYLLMELEGYLNLNESGYNEEDKCFYPTNTKELKGIYELEMNNANKKDIPYWKEMILLWSSGWSGFGLEYPGQDNSIVQPIVKTYSPEDRG